MEILLGKKSIYMELVEAPSQEDVCRVKNLFVEYQSITCSSQDATIPIFVPAF